MGCTLAPTGEYDWTVHVRQRCCLMSNYFDHLLMLSFFLLFGRPLVKRFALYYGTVVCLCLSCLSVCNVWPNSWMDQDVTWYGDRPTVLQKVWQCGWVKKVDKAISGHSTTKDSFTPVAMRCVALRCRAAPHVDACCKLMLMYAKYVQEEILMSNSIKCHIPHFLDVFFVVHYNVIYHIILELDPSITRNPTLQ